MNFTLDFQTIVMAMLSVACTVLGWLARELWDAVKELRKSMVELEVRITRDYVSYDRLDKIMQPISEALDRIERTLVGKADK